MHCLSLISVLLSLTLATSLELSPSHWVLHEKRSRIPTGWRFSRKHHASAILPLRVALAQSNIGKIDEFLNDVSHPESPNYGEHWSAAKVVSTFAPSHETVDAVRDWLSESGIDPQRITPSRSKGWLEFQASVGEVENLFQTTYNVYEHDTGIEHVACEGYHLPRHLSQHVDFIHPTVNFDVRLPKRSNDGVTSHALRTSGPKNGLTAEVVPDQIQDCDTLITPACLRALYGLYYEPVATDKNSFGVVEYSPVTYLQDDLNLFAQMFSPDLVGVDPQTVFIDGNASVAFSTVENFTMNGEADLDLEYAMNLVTKRQPVTLYQVGDVIEGASFNNFLDALDSSYCAGGLNSSVDGIYPDNKPGGYNESETCGTIKPASVISTSYSYDEADLTLKYAARQCNEYAKLGLLGVTFLYSSGDYGVAGYLGRCLNPDGVRNETGEIFSPTFPSTCPYVTSVGATQVSPGQTVYDPESACEEVIQSSGGFSNYFALPDYQKDAVTSYLTNYPPSYPSDIWNSTGKSRAFPDMAANGANYVIAIDGNFTRVYGTSASTPVVGAILTMVNDARLAMGKSTIGFINPTIYRPDFRCAFNDVTNGTNPGCGTLGFNTSVGWDPVTGLGTPNFGMLLAKWLELP